MFSSAPIASNVSMRRPAWTSVCSRQPAYTSSWRSSTGFSASSMSSHAGITSGRGVNPAFAGAIPRCFCCSRIDARCAYQPPLNRPAYRSDHAGGRWCGAWVEPGAKRTNNGFLEASACWVRTQSMAWSAGSSVRWDPPRAVRSGSTGVVPSRAAEQPLSVKVVANVAGATAPRWPSAPAHRTHRTPRSPRGRAARRVRSGRPSGGSSGSIGGNALFRVVGVGGDQTEVMTVRDRQPLATTVQRSDHAR